MTAAQNTSPVPQAEVEHKFADETALEYLRPFVPAGQYAALADYCENSEERDYYRQLVRKFADRIRTMPGSYGQRDIDDPIVHLHYFQGGMDFHITEKDKEAEQHQAFGLANLGYGGELGYISIVELVENKIELDLYFEPTPLSKVMED